MKRIFVKQGKTIVEEGTMSDCAYIIESGSVEVSKTGADGSTKVMGILREKDIFGELGLIDGLPRAATVTALEDCTVSVLTPETFNSLARRNPQAIMPILKILVTRLRSTLKVVEELQDNASRKSLAPRV